MGPRRRVMLRYRNKPSPLNFANSSLVCKIVKNEDRITDGLYLNTPVRAIQKSGTQ